MTVITAKQEPNSEKKGPSKACRYFKKGFCGYGEQCLYRHIYPKSRSEVVNCRFYKKASCKFASKCWNKHIPPNGKVYPKPGPLNKFIVVGPFGEEPDETEDSIPIPAQKEEIGISGEEHDETEDSIPIQKEEILRNSVKRPRNQDQVSKNCFYYEMKGTCLYGDKCWYSHCQTYVPPADELPHEENPGLEQEPEPDPDRTKMCYNFIFTECEFGDKCLYVHGDICQFCDLPFLHPFDERQRNEHLEACEIFFIEDMDFSFKVMNSKDKMCAICLDHVWNPDKQFTKQIFGIQEKCNHIFCLFCIREWRAVKFDEGRPRECPECRTHSDILLPSAYWFENDKEKQQMLQDYEAAKAKKPCKLYEIGGCRRGEKCKYSHAGPVKRQSPLWEYHVVERGISDWGDSESSNQSPSGEQEDSNTLAAEGVAADRDQQDAGWQDLPERQQDAGLQDPQEQESSDDTPPVDQANVNLQSGQQVVPSNLANEHQLDGSFAQVNVVEGNQNVEEQVQQDEGIW